MSIATLKEELLRELAVAALGDTARFQPIGGATDLIDWHWQSEPDSVLRRAWVFRDRGPALIVAHVRDGARLWLVTGTFPQNGIVSIVETNVVHWTDDHVGVSRLCVRFETEHMPLFPEPSHIAAFLSNVLHGHVQDA